MKGQRGRAGCRAKERKGNILVGVYAEERCAAKEKERKKWKKGFEYVKMDNRSERGVGGVRDNRK